MLSHLTSSVPLSGFKSSLHLSHRQEGIVFPKELWQLEFGKDLSPHPNHRSTFLRTTVRVGIVSHHFKAVLYIYPKCMENALKWVSSSQSQEAIPVAFLMLQFYAHLFQSKIHWPEWDLLLKIALHSACILNNPFKTNTQTDKLHRWKGLHGKKTKQKSLQSHWTKMTVIKLSTLERIKRLGLFYLWTKMSKRIHDVSLQTMNGIKKIGQETSIHSLVL